MCVITIKNISREEEGYMANKQNAIPFYKRAWVSSIGVFLLSQIIFIIWQTTGWMPKFKEIDGTVFGKITESSFFKEWLTFYEIPWFNLITVFFAIAFLVPGVIGAVINVIPNLTRKESKI